ncbi:MAG: sulfite exporter TauE/SafE family protein [Candidatus Pelagadaptatus aseana]|uniref:sulfite exporter TauE/SafE family protein n=1 Tax=Candidatus Pelagadaptatus aseana TaxID=3120508 RepID=UPI0039B1CBA5
MEILLYILSGAAVGLAIGITGVGGGSLMTPLLILMGFPYHIAIGTDLLYAAITKAAGVAAHHRQRTIRWDIVFYLGAGSIPASLLTAFLLDRVFTGADDYGPLLTSSLGFMLIFTALVLIFKDRIQGNSNPGETKGFMQSHSKPLTVFMGVFLGVFVTLTSVGAGAIGTAILLVLYPRLKALNIVGTDIAHAVPLTLIAGLGHLIFLGNVDFLLLACLLVGSLPAVHVGTKIGARLPSNVLRPILALILMVLGAKFALF